MTCLECNRREAALIPVSLCMIQVILSSLAGLESCGVMKTLINTVHPSDRPESLAFSRELLLKLPGSSVLTQPVTSSMTSPKHKYASNAGRLAAARTQDPKKTRQISVPIIPKKTPRPRGGQRGSHVFLSGILYSTGIIRPGLDKIRARAIKSTFGAER